MIQRFTIPGQLPGLNELIKKDRANRYAGAALKKESTNLCAACIMAARIRPPAAFPVMVLIRWVEPNGRRDPDNIASGKKYILDALQAVGVLPNDGQKQICGFRDSFSVDPKDPRIEVVLIDSEKTCCDVATEDGL